jgi:hypothetical protein
MGLTFSQQMNAWAAKTGKKVEDHVIATRVQISKGILQRTPVDTGRARASWIATLGEKSTTVFEEEDDYPSDNALLSQIKRTAKQEVSGIFWMTNNLPYIRALEYGSSKIQAPEGMVRVTMAEFKIGMKEILE